MNNTSIFEINSSGSLVPIYQITQQILAEGNNFLIRPKLNTHLSIEQASLNKQIMKTLQRNADLMLSSSVLPALIGRSSSPRDAKSRQPSLIFLHVSVEATFASTDLLFRP
jgi:hypothetical protein